MLFIRPSGEGVRLDPPPHPKRKFALRDKQIAVYMVWWSYRRSGLSVRDIADLTRHAVSTVSEGIRKAESYVVGLIAHYEDTHVPCLHPRFGAGQLTPAKEADGGQPCSRCRDGALLHNLDVCGYCHRTTPQVQRRLNAQLNRDDAAESALDLNWQLTA